MNTFDINKALKAPTSAVAKNKVAGGKRGADGIDGI